MINLYNPGTSSNASYLLQQYKEAVAGGKVGLAKYQLRHGKWAWGYGVQVRPCMV